MLTLSSLNIDKYLSVFLAIKFAEKSLPIWESEYPEDTDPKKAIKKAKEWLNSPTSTTAAKAELNTAASAASRASSRAAYRARGTFAAKAAKAARAARAALAAAKAASTAALAASAACNHTISVAHHYAEYTLSRSATALGVDEESLAHEVILENLGWIFQYKVDNKQSFAEPELIFNYLDERWKQIFLFSLDVVA